MCVCVWEGRGEGGGGVKRVGRDRYEKGSYRIYVYAGNKGPVLCILIRIFIVKVQQQRIL